MNKKVNKYLNKSSFSKLLLFNWVQIRNNWLFWFLMILNIIAQPLTICLVYYLSNNFNKYEIFIILVPLISSFIQIMLLVYSLYIENKNNSIDYKLFCSKYSRYHIAISRIVLIFITLIPIVIINALFSIFFIVQNMMAFFGALLVSNLLINSFVYTFMICLLVLISEKMGRILYIFLGFFLAFVTLGISLISRPYLTNKTSNYLEYVSLMQDENQEKNSIFQTNKLISEDSKDILVFKNLTTSNLTVNDLINDINKKSVFYNNFIPSEWLLSFYSSVFSLFNFELNYSHEPYSILRTNVNSNVNANLNDLKNFYAIRPIDINFSKLENAEYMDLILKDIDKIINKYDLMTDLGRLNLFSSAFEIDVENNNSIKNWNALNLYTKEFLKDATGINTEFNQLFYIIKYNQLLTSKLDGIFKEISSTYNEKISLLFKNVLSSPITFLNVFQVNIFDISNLILGTEKFIYDFYPMIETINPIKPITLNDESFLKNTLVKFDENNSLMLLTNNLYYLTLDEIQLSSFNSAIQKVSDNKIKVINNQNDWNNFVDQLSLSYNTANNFLKTLRTNFINAFNYQLMNNWYDISNFVAILNPINGNQNGYAVIFILIYIVLFLLLISLIIKKYRSYYKQQ